MPKYLVGGPPNSGKSTTVLSLTKRLTSGLGRTARAIELDVWSGSYAAFEGKVSFKDRPKKFGLDWDWKTPLDERIAQFNESTEDFVFGDLPGAKIDAATDHMCANARADGAIVISATQEGLKLWREAFEARGVKVIHAVLSSQQDIGFIIQDMGRVIDPDHPDIAALSEIAIEAAGTDGRRHTRAMDQRFLTVFKQNYARRSRTAHGVDDNLDAPLKKRLMMTGRPLNLKAMSNCVHLAKDVLATPRPAAWEASVFRTHCERWFDLANDGIAGPDRYAEEYADLVEDARLMERNFGKKVALNPRYRIWTPEHTLSKVSPPLLEEHMDAFYAQLAGRVAEADGHRGSLKPAVEAMAYADLMMDGELRPWLDGCGRVATALVMWIARVLDAPLPLFALSKDVHKMTIRDLERHRRYFLECIQRAEREQP